MSLYLQQSENCQTLEPLDGFLNRLEHSQKPQIVKNGADRFFLKSFAEDYRIEQDDLNELQTYIDAQVNRMVGERFIRLLEFFERCKIPKLVVFATLATGGGMKMTDIADRCGVSKQAIHKAFRRMEPEMKIAGHGFQRRRNFKNSQQEKPNEEEINGDEVEV